MKSSHLWGLFLCFAFYLVTSQGYRLPETLIPFRYEVDLVIPEAAFSAESANFTGSVSIQFTANSSTSEVKLHHRVNPTNILLFNSIGESISTNNNTYNETTEILTIYLAQDLTVASTYTLDIDYNAAFETSAMRGFYISTYVDENNATAYLLTTQFQPTSARHGFPCFDEPQYKAVFAINLTYPSEYNALSNTDSVSDTAVNSTYTKSVFKDTTTMSTYLVAFIISKFTCTTGDTIESGVDHRVCSRDEEKPDRTWAVEVGTPLLRTLESMTGIRYANYMPKMDQVAIPDFSAGAMENWGLVTYRETGLLFSEEHTSNIYKKNIATVIAHEFTHMWFGDLVTCKWWDYTFLNEGFARFYQYFATAVTKQFLDWELEKHFIVEQVHTALLADSVSTAQALTSTATTAGQVSGKFSTISYNKGACIYRMIETNIMGSDNFIYGIRDYLAENQLTGTVPADLWKSLAKFVPSVALPTNVDLSTVLNNWVELNGHPAVSATKSGNDIILSQERFLLSANDTTQYYVPITYTVSSDVTKFSNTTVKAWLVPGANLTLPNVLEGSSWIILNNRQSGFYRVNYDNSLWEAILTQLNTNHLAIDVLNRAQIVSDAFNYARSGRNGGYGSWDYTNAMRVLKYLENEVDYFPWYAAIIGNNHLLQRIGYDSEEGQKFTAWMLKLMQKVYSTVPFDTLDSSNQVYTMKQIMILTRVCNYGGADCISSSKKLFADYRQNGVSVPKNLRTVVYCNALRHSDDVQGDFDFLWQKYTQTKLSSEIMTIYSGLGCAENTTVLKWYLGQTINSTSGIRVQDFSSVWSYVYSSGKTGTLASLEFIEENYAALNNASASVGSLISSISNYIYDEEQLAKLSGLSSITGLTAAHTSAVANAVNVSTDAITWAQLLKADVVTYLNAENASAGVAISKSSTYLLLFALVALLIRMF